jgi:hypothetical protein
MLEGPLAGSGCRVKATIWPMSCGHAHARASLMRGAGDANKTRRRAKRVNIATEGCLGGVAERRSEVGQIAGSRRCDSVTGSPGKACACSSRDAPNMVETGATTRQAPRTPTHRQTDHRHHITSVYELVTTPSTRPCPDTAANSNDQPLSSTLTRTCHLSTSLHLADLKLCIDATILYVQ